MLECVVHEETLGGGHNFPMMEITSKALECHSGEVFDEPLILDDMVLVCRMYHRHFSSDSYENIDLSGLIMILMLMRLLLFGATVMAISLEVAVYLMCSCPFLWLILEIMER